MQSEIFDSHKGSRWWPQNTICELHRKIYDRIYVARECKDWSLLEGIVPVLEEAFVCGLKMTKKLTEYKLAHPTWTSNDDPEAMRLRKQRNELKRKLDEISDNL